MVFLGREFQIHSYNNVPEEHSSMITMLNGQTLKPRVADPNPTQGRSISINTYMGWDSDVLKHIAIGRPNSNPNVDCTSLGHAIQLQVAQPASPTSHLRSPTL